MHKKIFFVLLILIFSMINFGSSFSANIIFNSSENAPDGPVVVPYDKMIVTGDSYAGLFCDFEDNRDFILKGYAIAGRTIKDNKEIMRLALAEPEYKLCYICIGVNDHFQATPPYEFESTLRNILEVGVINKKYTFISSYANYPMSSLYNVYPISMYDNIIRKLSIEYPNVYYIDMQDYSNENYISFDNIHYGKGYYDIMYNKFMSIVQNIAF